MRKYLVNYRVDISATIPYLEYTAIYEVESMMTQEDVEAFEEAKTKEHGNTVEFLKYYEMCSKFDWECALNKLNMWLKDASLKVKEL